MKLLTKEIIRKLPALYSQDGLGDNAIVYIKFFTPDANWTWFVTEGSPIVVRDGEKIEVKTVEDVQQDDEIIDWIFFGLVKGMETELGNFTLSDLQSVRGSLGLPVKRDKYFGFKHTLGEVRE